MTPQEFKDKYFDKMTLEEKFKFMEFYVKELKKFWGIKDKKNIKKR